MDDPNGVTRSVAMSLQVFHVRTYPAPKSNVFLSLRAVIGTQSHQQLQRTKLCFRDARAELHVPSSVSGPYLSLCSHLTSCLFAGQGVACLPTAPALAT